MPAEIDLATGAVVVVEGIVAEGLRPGLQDAQGFLRVHRLTEGEGVVDKEAGVVGGECAEALAAGAGVLPPPFEEKSSILKVVAPSSNMPSLSVFAAASSSAWASLKEPSAP